VGDGAGRPAPNTRATELIEGVRAEGEKGGCSMERFVRSVVQIDPALNVRVANLG
jgi:hypothetical protein